MSITKKLHVIIDESFFSKAKLANLSLSKSKIEIINYQKNKENDLLNDLKNKKGLVLNLTSNRVFCLYRAKVYQLLSQCQNLKSYRSKVKKSHMLLNGSYIEDFVKTGENLKLGIHSIIGINSKIANNVNIGNFTSIGENVLIGSNSIIGSNVVIHNDVIIPPFSKIGKFNEISKYKNGNDLTYYEKRNKVNTDFFNGILSINNI